MKWLLHGCIEMHFRVSRSSLENREVEGKDGGESWVGFGVGRGSEENGGWKVVKN